MSLPQPAEILVVDDEDNMRFLLTEALSAQNCNVDTASGGESALDLVRSKEYDCIIMDVRMGKLGGIETLDQIKRVWPDVPVIMMTAFGSRKVAVEAMSKGAYDYFTKPFDINEMRIVVKRALEKKTLEAENRQLKQRLNPDAAFPRVVGGSEAIQKVYSLIGRIKNNDVTVLIQGESGTGKELIATVLHEQSPRHDKPLVKINCAAIPDTLLESELFGYEKGAFTGAGARKIGKFELADHGTLFLDEIGDMSLSTQAKLLRVIEEQAFERLGGTGTIHVNIRIIAATNQDLTRLVREKRFREDLFFRLNVVPIHLPPLRARREDIPLLIDHFLEESCHRYDTPARKFHPDVLHLFMCYDWPGNVRELANAIQRAVVITQGDIITRDALPSQMRGAAPESMLTLPPGLPAVDFDGSLQQMMDTIVTAAEKKLIEEALNRTDWSRTKTAQMLKICRKSLHNKMKKYGLLDKDAEEEPDDGE